MREFALVRMTHVQIVRRNAESEAKVRALEARCWTTNFIDLPAMAFRKYRSAVKSV